MASRGREQLLSRLSTFTPARWPGEPVSALDCARRGWRLEAGPLLRCCACEAAVPARLPGVGRPRLRAECVARLRRLVSDGHRAGCRWTTPLPAAQLRPPLPETPAGRRRLTTGVALLAAATVPLPDDTPLPEPQLEPEKAAALLTEALGTEPPHPDRAQTALYYSLAGWELTENERYLQCSFGCRTWDTTSRPPPEDALSGKVLTTGQDVIQDALDQCGLEELDFEMSFPDVPVASEGDEASEHASDGHTGSQDSDALERSDALPEAIVEEGDDVTESSGQSESDGSSQSSAAGKDTEEHATEAPQSEASPCSEVGVEDFDMGAAGDNASGPAAPADKVSDAGSPAEGGSVPDDAAPADKVSDGGSPAGGGGVPDDAAPADKVSDAGSPAGGGGVPDDAAPAEKVSDAGSPAGGGGVLDDAAPADKVSDAGSPAEGGGVPDEALQLSDDDDSSGAELLAPAPGVDAEDPVSLDVSQSPLSSESSAEVGSVHSSLSARDGSELSPPSSDGDGDGAESPPAEDESIADSSATSEVDAPASPPQDSGDGSSVSEESQHEGPLTLSFDESESRSTDGSVERSVSREASPGSEIDSRSASTGEDLGRDAPSDGGSSSEESPQYDDSTGTLPVTEAAGPAAPPTGPAAPPADPAAPPADPAAPPADETSTDAAEQQPRPAKRPCATPPGGAAKRPRRPPAGPLESHRCWCPWVSGVDGGEPGWRQAVAAISAAGRLSQDGDAGDRLWAEDAALDTMRRVWATLDQWTSPPNKAVLRA